MEVDAVFADVTNTIDTITRDLCYSKRAKDIYELLKPNVAQVIKHYDNVYFRFTPVLQDGSPRFIIWFCFTYPDQWPYELDCKEWESEHAAQNPNILSLWNKSERIWIAMTQYRPFYLSKDMMNMVSVHLSGQVPYDFAPEPHYSENSAAVQWGSSNQINRPIYPMPPNPPLKPSGSIADVRPTEHRSKQEPAESSSATGLSNNLISTAHTSTRRTREQVSYYANIEKLEQMSTINAKKVGEGLDRIIAMCDEYLKM